MYGLFNHHALRYFNESSVLDESGIEGDESLLAVSGIASQVRL